MPVSSRFFGPFRRAGHFSDLNARSRTTVIILGLLAIGILLERLISPAPLVLMAAAMAFYMLDAEWMHNLQPHPRHTGDGGIRWRNLGLAYLLPPLLAFCLLAVFQPAMLYWSIALTMVADMAAYFGGRAFGGLPLWSRVSPGKTWSGVTCGIFAALIISVFWQAYMPGLGLAIPLSEKAAFPAAMLVILAGIGGDLFESWLKRNAGVKDSGTIFGAHGGAIDRFDSQVAAITVTGLIALAAFLMS